MRQFILTLLFAFSLGISAQTKLPAQCEAFLPKILAKNLIFESELGKVNASNKYGQTGNPTHRYWIAYSDRDNNITYTSPNGGTAFSKLSFNEEVRIAKIQGNYALVYSERKNGAWPEISEMAQSKGWIPMDNLLLWQSCPVDDKGIYYKALIVANLDKQSNNDLGRIYTSPVDRTQSKQLKSTIEFFFVMKKDPKTGLVLLAKQYTLGGTNSQILKGWVNVNSFVAWNQRSCLEPNWNPDDVSYFKANHDTAKVYANVDLRARSAYFDFGKPNGHDNNHMTKFRMHHESLRYPILDNDTKDNSIYKCTCFGTARGSLTTAMLTESKKEEIKKKYLDMLAHVNLTIVIDGTSSMEKYFPTMKEAIKQAFDYLNKDYKVRVGVVIYRDYADGKYCYEYMPLQDKRDMARVNGFLDRGGDGKYGIKSSPKDHTHEEALYKGLEIALDHQKMGFSAQHSNLMLVIGDCGNDENDTKCLPQEELVNKLVKNNVQLMVFQVRRNNSKPWLLFTDQMNALLMGNMAAQYKTLGKKVRFKEISDGFDLETNSSKEIFVGTNRYADLGTDMSQDKLRQLIIKSISDFNKAILKQIEIIDNPKGFDPDKGFVVSSKTRENDASLDSAYTVGRVGMEYYKMIKQTHALAAFKGYTKKIDASGRAYWKPVVFISGDELDQLIKRLTPVYEVSRNGGNDRVPYVNAMKALIRSMLPDISDAEMDRKGTGEVMNLISGLNESTAALKGPSLVEIQDVNAVSHQQFQSICADFAKKFRNLQRIKQQHYEYVVVTNNKKHYWIPIEDMP